MTCIVDNWCITGDFILDFLGNATLFAVLGFAFFQITSLFLIMKFINRRKTKEIKRAKIDWSLGYDRLVSHADRVREKQYELSHIKTKTEFTK